jgi:hypothetical protein
MRISKSITVVLHLDIPIIIFSGMILLDLCLGYGPTFHSFTEPGLLWENFNSATTHCARWIKRSKCFYLWFTRALQISSKSIYYFLFISPIFTNLVVLENPSIQPYPKTWVCACLLRMRIGHSFLCFQCAVFESTVHNSRYSATKFGPKTIISCYSYQQIVLRMILVWECF